MQGRTSVDWGNGGNALWGSVNREVVIYDYN